MNPALIFFLGMIAAGILGGAGLISGRVIWVPIIAGLIIAVFVGVSKARKESPRKPKEEKKPAEDAEKKPEKPPVVGAKSENVEGKKDGKKLMAKAGRILLVLFTGFAILYVLIFLLPRAQWYVFKELRSMVHSKESMSSKTVEIDSKTQIPLQEVEKEQVQSSSSTKERPDADVDGEHHRLPEQSAEEIRERQRRVYGE